jgi:hypothetical protein
VAGEVVCNQRAQRLQALNVGRVCACQGSQQACVQGCVRPEACPSAEARARVQQLLEMRSLDELVAIATNSLEDRLMGRLPRDGGRAG